MLGQVIVDDQGVLALLHELLADGAAGVGGDVLQRGRLGGRGRNDDSVFHRTVLLKRGDHLGHLRLPLSDGDVNADQVLPFLVDDGVHHQGGLAGLPVADDQLALPASDRDHGVDRLDAGLDGHVHALAADHVGGDAFDGAEAVRFDRPLAVHRLAHRVHRAADHAVAHRDRDDASRAADKLALGDAGAFAHDNDAHVVGFEVEDDAQGAVVELHQLGGARVGQTAEAGDTVTHRQHGAHVHGARRRLERQDLLLKLRD